MMKGRWGATAIEAPFVLALAPHFFLLAAPTADIGLGGSQGTTNAMGTTTSIDAKATSFGLQLGLGGYF